MRYGAKVIGNESTKGCDTLGFFFAKDGEEVFQSQESSLGKFAARMLGVASKSGNMAEIYDNTAKFMERNYEFKKNLKSALMMPIITISRLFAGRSNE